MKKRGKDNKKILVVIVQIVILIVAGYFIYKNQIENKIFKGLGKFTTDDGEYSTADKMVLESEEEVLLAPPADPPDGQGNVHSWTWYIWEMDVCTVYCPPYMGGWGDVGPGYIFCEMFLGSYCTFYGQCKDGYLDLRNKQDPVTWLVGGCVSPSTQKDICTNTNTGETKKYNKKFEYCCNDAPDGPILYENGGVWIKKRRGEETCPTTPDPPIPGVTMKDRSYGDKFCPRLSQINQAGQAVATRIITKLLRAGCSVEITAIENACHVWDSNHYRGCAVDLIARGCTFPPDLLAPPGQYLTGKCTPSSRGAHHCKICNARGTPPWKPYI